MHNEGPASTSELTEEELLQTIISLQGGKTFGRAPDNKVIFVEDVPNQEKGYLNISRSHAEVFHVQTGEVDTYLVEDRSENGTYVNDLRLTKKTKQVLQSGDLIKFGHKNGSAFKPGEIALQAHADWTFLVETPSEKAAAMKQSNTLRVFPNSPIIQQVDHQDDQKEDTPVGRSTVVQQQEADSTNQEFLVEPQLFGSSNEHDIPSTSQSNAASDADMQLMEISRSIVEQLDQCHFKAKLNSVNVQGISPAVLETIHKIDLTSASSKEDKIQAIFNEVKKAVARQREPSPSNIVRRQTESVAVVDADSSNDVNAVSSLALGLNVSAFHPPVIPAMHPLVVPQPTNPVESDETFMNYLQNINVPQIIIHAIAQQRQMNFPSLSLLAATRTCLLQVNALTAYNSLWSAMYYRQHGFPLRPYAPEGVIRSTNRVIRRDTPDENRHSASSGSTTHSRQRTDSEESEIVDVVGTDDPREGEPPIPLVPADPDMPEDQDEQENDENADPLSPNFPAAEPLEYEIPENLSEGGTETPSPGPESGEPLQPIHALADHNIRDEVVIHHEEPNSNASSILGTPIGSPPQSIPSNSPEPVVEDVVENVEINEPVEIEEIAENREEERVTPAPQEVMEVVEEEENGQDEEQVAEDLRKKEEEARLRKEKLKKKRNEAAERRRLAAAEAEEKEKADQPEVVKEKKKKSRETRKMKQLDSEESDSDADDMENQKRSVRRSTRGKPTASVKERAVEEANEDDDSDAPIVDSPESRKLKRKRKQTAKRVSVRKSTARKSQVEEEEAVVESAAEDGDAESEEPKKKRGRKKESSTEVSLDNPNHPKNLCGVTEEYCIASYIDLTPKGSGVQWVQCETKGCKQWFHSYCVCLDNMRFKKRKNAHLRFYCCGPKLSVEATEGRNGDVYRRFEETYEEDDEEDQAEEAEKAAPSRKTKQEIKKSAR